MYVDFVIDLVLPLGSYRSAGGQSRSGTSQPVLSLGGAGVMVGGSMHVAPCAGSVGHIPFRRYQNIASGMNFFVSS